MHKLLTAILILSLVSCFGDRKPDPGEDSINLGSKGLEEFIKGHCIRDRFAQSQDDNLYGLECIEGKQIVIETSQTGSLVSTSAVSNSETGLRLEDNLGFKNKFYNATYTIQKRQGDAEKIPFLLNFLPEDEEFKGALNTKYHIIFKTMGNYLVLFQASKKLEDLPDIHRTSLKIFREGQVIDYDKKTYTKKEDDYYINYFIGYPIKYCKAEAKVISGVEYLENILNCEDSHLQDAPYIQVNIGSKNNFNYLIPSKKDLFPSDYFNGLWYFSEGWVESFTREGELAPLNTYLVQMEKEPDSLNLKDMSGDVEDRNRRNLHQIPVKWLEFEVAQDGRGQFTTFGERENLDTDETKRPYAQINFTKMKMSQYEIIDDLIDLVITPDYFSYIQKITINIPNHPLDGKTVKWKTSYLRAQTVNTEEFIPKRWFLDDHKNVFGFLYTAPQDESKQAETTENQLLDHVRMIRFNTHLSAEEEQRTNTKTITWHFSKNSTKDPEYRAVAKKAVDIYNQAFEHITRDSDKKIKVEIEQEEKDLGDLRYNIINLVKTEDLS
ncbi:MAG: hypothetical protein OXN83_02610, partial [Oligoflexia bacterium]|nr:hypothetical protein [Oligoflexia bacterium]